MTKKYIITTLMLIGLVSRLFSQEYRDHERFEKDGLTYEVLNSYWVVDSREVKDEIKSANQFHRGGDVAVVKVDQGMKDVVIPPSIGRYNVIGLADKLFYGHKHDRIYLPNLEYIGEKCFANLTLNSGILVLHNIAHVGNFAFDSLNAKIFFDQSKLSGYPRTADSLQVFFNGRGVPVYSMYVSNTQLKLHRQARYYNYLRGVGKKIYDNMILDAYNGDQTWVNMEFEKSDFNFCKKSYFSLVNNAKKGLLINIQRKSKGVAYNVKDIKKNKTAVYDDFEPVASPNDGWTLKFMNKKTNKEKDEQYVSEEVIYNRKGKVIKQTRYNSEGQVVK